MWPGDSQAFPFYIVCAYLCRFLELKIVFNFANVFPQIFVFFLAPLVVRNVSWNRVSFVVWFFIFIGSEDLINTGVNRKLNEKHTLNQIR